MKFQNRLISTAKFEFRNATHEERLLAFLFQDYEPVARAVLDVNKTVEVSVSFVLLRIHGLVSGWVGLWVGGRVDGWMDGWNDGWMDGWIDGWVDRWIDGWMGG